MEKEITKMKSSTDSKDYINFHHEEIEKIFTTVGYMIDIKETEKIKRLPRLTAIEDLENIIKYTLYSDKSPTELSVNRNCVDISLILLYHFRSHESTELLLDYIKKDIQYLFNWQHTRSLEHILPIFTYCATFHAKKFIALSTEANICYWNRIVIPLALNRISAMYPELRHKSIELLKELMLKYYIKRNDAGVFDIRFVGSMIDDIVKTGTRELLSDIEYYFDEDLVDESYCGTIEKIREEIKKGGITHKMIPQKNITGTLANYFIELFFSDNRYENEIETQCVIKNGTSKSRKSRRESVYEMFTKLLIFNVKNRKTSYKSAISTS